MGIGQIAHVDVIAHAGAIVGIVVRAEHVQLVAHSRRHEQGDRDQVRFGIVNFAELAIGIGPRSVEIAKGHRRDAEGRRVIAQDALDHQLRRAIGVDGILRIGLRNVMVHIAEGGAGGREDEPVHAREPHGTEQRQRAHHVGLVIGAWLADRFPDIGQRGKMHHRFDFVLLQQRGDAAGFKDVAMLERAVFHRPAVSGTQIVQHDRFMPRSLQRLARMRADEARTAGD